MRCCCLGRFVIPRKNFHKRGYNPKVAKELNKTLHEEMSRLEGGDRLEAVHLWDSPHDTGGAVDRSGGRRQHLKQKQARAKRASLVASELAFRTYKSEYLANKARDGQGYIQARKRAEEEGWFDSIKRFCSRKT